MWGGECVCGGGGVAENVFKINVANCSIIFGQDYSFLTDEIPFEFLMVKLVNKIGNYLTKVQESRSWLSVCTAYLSIFPMFPSLPTPRPFHFCACRYLRDRSLFIAWGGAEDLGGIRWLSEELRGGISRN